MTDILENERKTSESEFSLFYNIMILPSFRIFQTNKHQNTLTSSYFISLFSAYTCKVKISIHFRCVFFHSMRFLQLCASRQGKFLIFANIFPLLVPILSPNTFDLMSGRTSSVHCQPVQDDICANGMRWDVEQAVSL